MMPSRLRCLLVVHGLLGLPSVAAASPSPAADGSSRPLEATAPSNTSEASGAVAPSTAVANSVAPVVADESGEPWPADEMLAPVPPPARVLRTWREALNYVRGRSTGLEQARAQVEIAAAQARLSLVPLYPRVSGTGQVRKDLLFNTTSNLPAGIAAQAFGNTGAATLWSANLTISQTLLAPKAYYDAQTSKLSARVRELEQADVERVILANVADTILAAVTAERLGEISRVNLSSALSTLDLTRRRARLGAGNALDVLRAEQEVTVLRGQLLSANESIRRSREALGMALGYSEAVAVTPDIRIAELARDAREVCTPTELEQRADLRALRAGKSVLQRNVESNSWLLSPTLDVASAVTYSTAPFTTNGKPAQWIISAVLNVPLYDGGLRAGQARAATAQARAQAAQLTQAERQARLEVQQANRAVTVAEANFAVSRRTRELATETARLAKLSFVNGQGTSFELVDASRRLQQAELDLVVKEFEVVRARILALLATANCNV